MALWRFFPKLLTPNHKELPFRQVTKDFSTVQSLWRTFRRKCNEHLCMLGEIFTKQCHFYAFQRVRRANQIHLLYARLYNERAFRGMVSGLVRRLAQRQKKTPLGLMLSALVFSWEKDRVTDEEIKDSIQDFDELSRRKIVSDNASAQNEKNVPVCTSSAGWEVIVSNHHICVWRKQVASSYLYEYKVFGTFYDIPARTFFNVQTDTEYRKKWDKLVIKLDVIDREERGSEVLYWVMHYPYPMYSRDYVYVRRAVVDAANSVMVLVSRAVQHPMCPEDNKYVRVKKYTSRMVIRPHSTFDENGFDYLLTYFDDPDAAFPAPAYNWMACTGVPDFVNKLHHAAQDLHKQPRLDQTTFPEPCLSSGPLPVYA